MRFRVRTETESFYVIDTTARTMVRVPAADGDDLEGDFTLIHFDDISSLDPEVGKQLVIKWKNNTKMRITSAITEVVKLSEPA